jgi:YjbR
MNRRVNLFRRIALSLPGAAESSHMGHPDFRLNGRIFATLSAQEKDCGVVKLTPEQQQSFITERPQAFSPVQGGWGGMGMTFTSLLSQALSKLRITIFRRSSPTRNPAERRSLPGLRTNAYNNHREHQPLRTL